MCRRGFHLFDFQDEEQLPPAAEALGLADAPASPDSEAAAGGAPSLLPRAPRQSLFRKHLHRLLSKWYETFPPSAPTASSRLCPGQASDQLEVAAIIVPSTAASKEQLRRSIEELEITISDVEGECEAPASFAAAVGGAPPNQAASVAPAASPARSRGRHSNQATPVASPAKMASGAYSPPPPPPRFEEGSLIPCVIFTSIESLV